MVHRYSKKGEYPVDPRSVVAQPSKVQQSLAAKAHAKPDTSFCIEEESFSFVS